MIHNHLLRITHHDSQSLPQLNTPWFTTTGSAYHTVCWTQWLGIMVFYAEPVIVNHVLLCWASVCESLLFMLSQWLWIMVYDAEPEVVNHGELCRASGYDSCCAAHHSTPWFTTTGSVQLTMIHNHWFSIAHHDSQPLAHSSLTMIHHHWLRITHHDSQPLAQNNTPWFTTTGSA
jgi:hypothetical protein